MVDFWKNKNVMVIFLSIKEIVGILWVEGICVVVMGKMIVNFSIFLF